jgi:uncharacterized protein YdeI (YjbR/CyaY-like superfamily)
LVKPAQNVERVEVKSRRELRKWLTLNHERITGVWLTSYKKESKYYLPYGDLVEECLCFGWVDSLPRALDEARSMHYIAPRKWKSAWSKVNKHKIAQLTRSGLMSSSGLAKVEAAKKDGSWDLLNNVEAGIIDEDLANTLASYPMARKNFDKFPPSSKRLILEWIAQAKRPETRAKRIADTAKKANDNLRANHFRQ